MNLSSTIIPNITAELTASIVRQCTTAASVCKDGIVMPRWEPVDNLTFGDMFIRSLLYFLGLMYLFMGVGIISDRFMSAIEVITSQEKKMEIKDQNGEKQVVMVRVWNETISNLTLMALGSSAPEIMLSIIEVCGNKFEAGDLGPNTIVGSAAYNLFVIIGYCILVVPDGEVRRIKHLRVFFVTASWSIFAYVWLYLIISVFSPGVVEWWEGLLTFIYFPLTVLTAYWVDKNLLTNNFLTKKILNVGIIRNLTKRAAPNEQKTTQNDQPMALLDAEAGIKRDEAAQGSNVNLDNEAKNFEENRREYINLLKELRQKNPQAGVDELQQLACAEIINRGPKSRAYYRIQATRKLIGGTANIKKRMAEKESLNKSVSKVSLNAHEEVDAHITQVFFDPSHYTCFENVGYLDVYVARAGGDLSKTVLVDYKTEDGSAEANKDYVPAEGTLVFFPGETRKKFSVKILDDDVYEEDETFYAKILNVRYKNDNENNLGEPTVKLVHPSVATIMVLDDDHHGIFLFAEESQEVSENAGAVVVKVIRTSGARGKITIPYKTIDISAVGGRDYEVKEEYLVFNNNETEKLIEIGIVDDEDYQKNEQFAIELGEPIYEQEEDENEAGRPRLGVRPTITVTIKEGKLVKGIVDKLLNSSANTAMLVGTSSWTEQFRDAFNVEVDDDDEGEGEEGEQKEPKKPSTSDYISHYISLPWKIIFAFVPPTDIKGGYACFLVSIFLIGVLTAIIGDFASAFGCSIGLKDSVTAISFVALGTSLPDTFASKVAAINDKYADSSVGNVTGSNAVNVFLGIGLAWSIAAFYHLFNGTEFIVDPGSLGFSVTIFCTFAFVAIALMMARRHKSIGGELGGPKNSRVFTSSLFFGLWLLYLLLSSLETYCVIKGF